MINLAGETIDARCVGCVYIYTYKCMSFFLCGRLLVLFGTTQENCTATGNSRASLTSSRGPPPTHPRTYCRQCLRFIQAA
jgi:hypothetical protein